jgi:hypothetical protein
MHPKLTVVTFSPVRPSVLNRGFPIDTGAAAGTANAALASATFDVFASPAAGNATLAARNLRREESEFIVPPKLSALIVDESFHYRRVGFAF